MVEMKVLRAKEEVKYLMRDLVAYKELSVPFSDAGCA